MASSRPVPTMVSREPTPLAITRPASAAHAKTDRLLAEAEGLPAELEELLLQSANALRSVRALTELVERDPQAFLRGKSATGGR